MKGMHRRIRQRRTNGFIYLLQICVHLGASVDDNFESPDILETYRSQEWRGQETTPQQKFFLGSPSAARHLSERG
jgi:hypothetical protein